MERSTVDTKKVISSHFVESSYPSLTTVLLEVQPSNRGLGIEAKMSRYGVIVPMALYGAEAVHSTILL